MIKNIIFDLGGVIMTISQPQALERFKALGLKDAERQLDPYTQSGIFGDLEEGKITAEDFRRELSKLVGRELTFDEYKHAWLGYRWEVPQRNLDFLKELRAQGYRLVLLSNTNPFMMSWGLSEEFDGNGKSLYDYFDALYLSFKLGVMKPNEKFFRTVMESENINPEESVFVDDGPRNVAAAANLGLHTLCPENGSDWTGDLKELLKTVR
ncbi:MAG: HAD family phosphatase [Prevotellaceae bacterium]|nr:HAD family phosphatase [Prevotellaceae bacterium]